MYDHKSELLIDGSKDLIECIQELSKSFEKNPIPAIDIDFGMFMVMTFVEPGKCTPTIFVSFMGDTEIMRAVFRKCMNDNKNFKQFIESLHER